MISITSITMLTDCEAINACYCVHDNEWSKYQSGTWQSNYFCSNLGGGGGYFKIPSLTTCSISYFNVSIEIVFTV